MIINNFSKVSTYKVGLALGLSLVLGLSGCNSGGSSSSSSGQSPNQTPTPNNTNELPVAKAGADVTVTSKQVVTLDGSQSTDTDGRIVSYSWKQTFGPAVELTNSTNSQLQFTAPEVSVDTVFTFELTVQDDAGAKATDTVTVLVKANSNKAPVANAGADQSVASNTPFVLFGKGTDTDGTVVSYQWTQVSGPAVTLSDANQANIAFKTPTVAIATNLVFSLKVTDDKGATHTDTVTIQVKPVAVITTPQVQITPVEPDGATLKWEAIAGISKYFICQAQEPIVDIAKCTTYKLGKWIPVSNATSYQATHLRMNETTYFRVVAEDDNGNRSPASAEVKITPILSKPTHPLNDTGVTYCLDQVNKVCSTLDKSVLLQDAFAGRDATHNDDSDGHAGFSFSKLDFQGAALSAKASSWNCVRDNVTGLVWEKKITQGDNGLHDQDYTFSEKEIALPVNCPTCSIAQYVASVNKAGYCGFNDWRVPTAFELRSIMDYSYTKEGETLVDSQYFPDIKSTDFYVTSTPSYYYNFTRPVVLAFDYLKEDSFVASEPLTSTAYKVRLVRSATTK
ncbi:DUF1566 domain-containing protein [Thiofilum flexile]|uniref:Lcl C-terminal domain-containing protein n=1 Tax=Thiofilum flexile TaxID=125627 RepID=UPI00037A19FA|nr:DUF1566 domain-containing protein [Thiofilum flexile]